MVPSDPFHLVAFCFKYRNGSLFSGKTFPFLIAVNALSFINHCGLGGSLGLGGAELGPLLLSLSPKHGILGASGDSHPLRSSYDEGLLSFDKLRVSGALRCQE